MLGIPSKSKDAISTVIDNLFDRMAVHLLGRIPKLKGKKLAFIATKNAIDLPTLFIRSLDSGYPNRKESDILRGLLNASYLHIDSLKEKTKASIIEELDSAIKNNGQISEKQLNKIIDNQLKKAKENLEMISSSEATKTRNTANALSIAKISDAIGDDEPNVFFKVMNSSPCSECIKVHLHPDGTPKVFKLSEVKYGYHKRGDNSPSINGLHPHCMCTLVYITKGFGFKDGRVGFINLNHDEYSHQKKKY